MKEIVGVIVICLYFIGMLLCFGIARYVYRDKEGSYPAGGSAEVAIMLFVGFIPIVNVILSFIIVLHHIIEKSRK